MNFEDLLGKAVDFHGVDCNVVCLGVDGELYAFEAVEDPSDGYRSMLQEVKRVSPSQGIFFASPVARLTVEDARDGAGYNSFAGYKLVDEAGHAWLRMGTSNWDDYYPCFTFDYDPPRETL